MKRVSRALAALTAAGLAVPLWAVPASAQAPTATETASSVAYFFSGGTFQPDNVPAPPPNLLAERGLDFVGEGNLGVAAVASREDKVSFAFFSLSDVPFGSTITKATLTLKLAPEDNQNRRIAPGSQQVRACSPDDTGFGGEDGRSISQAPARKCDVFTTNALPESTADQYSFDITALAANWADMNDGVAITKRDDSSPNFQVVFTPDAMLTYEFVAPPEGDFGDLGGATSDVTSDLGGGGVDAGGFSDGGGGSLDAGGFSGGGSTDFGGGGGGFDSAVAGPLTGAELPAGLSPETAVDSPAIAAQTRAAPVGAFEQLSPTLGFWLAALLLGGALAFLSLVMGDPRTATAAATSKPSRLSEALSSARRGGSAPLLGARGA